MKLLAFETKFVKFLFFCDKSLEIRDKRFQIFFVSFGTKSCDSFVFLGWKFPWPKFQIQIKTMNAQKCHASRLLCQGQLFPTFASDAKFANFCLFGTKVSKPLSFFFFLNWRPTIFLKFYLKISVSQAIRNSKSDLT